MALADKQPWGFGRPRITDDAKQFWVFGKPAVVRNGTVVDLTVKRFTADAYIRGTYAKTFSADAIVGQYLKAFSADAIVYLQGTKTFSVDAVLHSKPAIVSPKDGSPENSPVYLVFTTTTDSAPGNKKHFQLQVDKTSSAFGDLELDIDSQTSQANWQYWDGVAWQSLPSSGLDSAYFGNNVRYQATLTDGNKWWRVRETFGE